jgi:BirA family biotin operon repressor/biotin-[acetyl-CoA-carboxylase] ligase
MKKTLIPLSEEKIHALQKFTSKIPIVVFQSMGSTNDYLIQESKNHSDAGLVCLAEHQTAGRGRRGKKWVAPANVNIYCSILWTLNRASHTLSHLSLLVGLAVLRTLNQFEIPQLGLKWPNDVLQAQQKLAGILIEIVHAQATSCTVVIGIGINANAPTEKIEIDQAWTCMEFARGKPVDRNQVVALLLDELSALFELLSQQKENTLLGEWSRWDILKNKPVRLQSEEKIWNGIARGIDQQGQLCVEIEGTLQRFSNGEISVRLDG